MNFWAEAFIVAGLFNKCFECLVCHFKYVRKSFLVIRFGQIGAEGDGEPYWEMCQTREAAVK